MNNEEISKKINQVKNNLENAKTQLRNAKNILNDSITFDNEGYKDIEIAALNTRLSKQISAINSKIIPNLDVQTNTSSTQTVSKTETNGTSSEISTFSNKKVSNIRGKTSVLNMK